MHFLMVLKNTLSETNNFFHLIPLIVKNDKLSIVLQKLLLEVYYIS